MREKTETAYNLDQIEKDHAIGNSRHNNFIR